MAQEPTEGTLVGNALAALEASKSEAEEREEEARALAFDFFFVKGLYSTVDLDTPVGELVENQIRYGAHGFDAYCVNCKRETTFRVHSKDIPGRGANSRLGVPTASPPSLIAVHATCQRDYTVYSYIVAMTLGKATKIGQRPSMADLAFGELKTIDRSLDKDDRRELGQALGLYAHDTAIGAFVYLRRVFERMVQRAHDRQSLADKPIDGFDTMRMDERIAALKNELPEKVVKSSAVFAVLSLGLHELTEDECIKFFPVLKAVLFQMLEQEEHKRKAVIAARETDAALDRILEDINRPAEA